MLGKNTFILFIPIIRSLRNYAITRTVTNNIIDNFETNPTTKFIINHRLPECRNCKYFMPHDSEIHKYSLGRCKLYGFKNIVSGETRYEYADHCRQDHKQCTIQGFNFEPFVVTDEIKENTEEKN